VTGPIDLLTSSAVDEMRPVAHPKIEVLGVYGLLVTDELFRAQFDILYGYPMSAGERPNAEQECREQLESVVLVEAVVSDRDSRFRVGDFAQARPGQPKDNWQVAWAEAFLTADGEALSVPRWSAAPPDEPLRIAFFIHYWDPARPLLSSYGEVQCPAPRPMPERLSRLVPFEPVD
jgi:hypothetical protein